jgi:hypothetical protein
VGRKPVADIVIQQLVFDDREQFKLTGIAEIELFRLLSLGFRQIS